MTDTSETRVEARLRATLRAVVDTEAVVDDFAALRRRSAESTIPWSDPGRNRRGRRLLVAAVLVAVTVTAVGAVAVLTRGHTEPVITDEPPPMPATGFYLPTGLGTEWELVDLAVDATTWPIDQRSDIVRVARFTSTRPSSGPGFGASPWIRAEVRRIGPSSSVPLRPEAQPLARGTGDDARTYRVWPEAAEGEAGSEGDAGAGQKSETATYVEAARDDLVLAVEGFGVGGLEPLLDIVDRWWDSGGEVLAVDPGLGLHREEDMTYRPASETSGPEGRATDASGLVSLVLRGPSGRIALLTLSVPGAALPTGADEPDRGTSAGLTGDERPRSVDVVRLGAEAWAWEGADNGGVARVFVSLPSLGIGLSGLRGDPETQTVGPPDALPADLDELLELLAALEPVSAPRWAEAVGQLDGGQAAVAPDLASLFLPSDADPAGSERTPGG